MSTPNTNAGETDRGTSLIEMLVVVAVISLVTTVIAFTFITIIRTTPATEARTDDSRTLLGLTIRLPEDVNSTPRLGYDFGKTTSTGCTGVDVGVNLVHLTWTELSDTYRASYRLTSDADASRIERFTCVNGGTVQRLNLTSDLAPIDESTWAPGDAPAVVTPVFDSGDVVGLSFEVTTVAGEVFSIESRTNNPAETLPPAPAVVYPPPPPGNQAPTAGPPLATTAPLSATTTILLNGSDPDGDALTTTVSAVTPGWTVTPTTGLEVDITPPVTALAGESGTFDYTLTDAYGQTDSSSAAVTLVAAPVNNPPSASNVVSTIDERTPVVIDLPVSDPDADPLTVTVSGVPSSLTVTVSGTQLIVSSDGTTASPSTFLYTVTDGIVTVSASVTITVTLCQLNSLTPGNASVAKFTNGSKKDTLKSSVTFTVSTTGNCDSIVNLAYDNDSSGTLSFITFNSVTNQVTFARQAETWTGATDFTLTVYVRGVATGTTSTMEVTS